MEVMLHFIVVAIEAVVRAEFVLGHPVLHLAEEYEREDRLERAHDQRERQEGVHVRDHGLGRRGLPVLSDRNHGEVVQVRPPLVSRRHVVHADTARLSLRATVGPADVLGGPAFPAAHAAPIV